MPCEDGSFFWITFRNTDSVGEPPMINGKESTEALSEESTGHNMNKGQ